MNYTAMTTLLRNQYGRSGPQVKRIMSDTLNKGQSTFTSDGKRYKVTRTMEPDSWKIELA